MANLPLAFAELLVGGVLIDAGIKGASVADVVRGQAQVAQLDGTASPSGSGAAPAGGAVAIGQVTQPDLQAVAGQHHWGPGEIVAWVQVIRKESGGVLTARNPQSGAYGIGQGITGPGWYAAHGGNAGTVVGQLTGMANYIAQRYGTPTAALAFHNANGWY